MTIAMKTARSALHHPRRHAAVRTKEYVFSQLIPYIGNKRKLLHLIAEAVGFTGCDNGTFVDLFAGSTVVARWAKKKGFRVLANDWEPYSHAIAFGTVVQNKVPRFSALGGCENVFEKLNNLPPLHGYIARHLCPRDDDNPDIERERMFFSRANGERIDAIREQLAIWDSKGLISADELAYVLAALIYATSYASNTSGVFKGFHNGWGGKTQTALYRILAKLTLQQPVLYDNGKKNFAIRRDAQVLAGELKSLCGRTPDIVYIDPPYNQHPYGSNYHVLNTVTLWDKPKLNPSIVVNGCRRDKSAIRKDWRTKRRSPYNYSKKALGAFQQLVELVEAKWMLVSYSTDGNIGLRDMLSVLSKRGSLHVFTEKYKRYRVSTPRMSKRSHNIEFVVAVDLSRRSSAGCVDEIIKEIHRQEQIVSHTAAESE